VAPIPSGLVLRRPDLTPWPGALVQASTCRSAGTEATDCGSLFHYDPIGISFEHNTDEYQPKAETITLARRRGAWLAARSPLHMGSRQSGYRVVCLILQPEFVILAGEGCPEMGAATS
jgi:hypothetical protein